MSTQVLGELIKQWVDDYNHETVGTVKPWTESVAKEFASIPVETLIRDDYFLGYGNKVYPGVLEDIEKLWEARKNPEFNIHTFIDEEGIGSGKSSKTSILLWLLWFEASMHLNPQEYYGLRNNSTIAFICLSRSESQSRRVIFSDVWKCFQSPFNREYFPPSPRMRREIFISRNNTVIYAGTSSALSALGYNLLGGIVDEANFLEVIEDSKRASENEETYDAAKEMYDAILNRITSRFMRPDGSIPGLICMCSSPKYVNDFTSRMRKKAQTEGPASGIFWSRRPLWLARGLDKYESGDFFYVDVEKIEEVADPALISKLQNSEETIVDGIPLIVTKSKRR